MATMIHFGKELIRMNPTNPNRIEFSIDNGGHWTHRTTVTTCGDFQDLIDNGNEILATTTKGVYFSTNKGQSWTKRSNH